MCCLLCHFYMLSHFHLPLCAGTQRNITVNPILCILNDDSFLVKCQVCCLSAPMILNLNPNILLFLMGLLLPPTVCLVKLQSLILYIDFLVILLPTFISNSDPMTATPIFSVVFDASVSVCTGNYMQSCTVWELISFLYH